MTWEVNQHKDKIRSGDTVYVWQSGPSAGIVAVAHTLSEPKSMQMYESENPFVRKPERFSEIATRVPISINRVLEKPILKETLSNHRALSNLRILKAPYGSNFSLTDKQAASLRELTGVKLRPFSKADALKELFINDDEFDYIINRLKTKKNIILQGPPGVGKTFIARRLAYSIMGVKDNIRAPMIQFHQSYSYEDFIQGFRPNDQGNFELRNGVFYEFCMAAQSDEPTNPYFFIIDEINRGNLSKIFGELLMLIEADKRGPDFSVPLTYSRTIIDKFCIPENLHLIGTMNTADRSLAMVDYALRRRFGFVYLKPQFTSVKFQGNLKMYGVKEELIGRIVDRITKLNEAIAEDTKNLGIGYQIGHSYFCPDKSGVTYDEDWYRYVIKSEIEPLLNEYWFDDPHKAQSLVRSILA